MTAATTLFYRIIASNVTLMIIVIVYLDILKSHKFANLAIILGKII